MSVTVTGAKGANYGTGTGGSGQKVSALYTVTPASTLYIFVGAQGPAGYDQSGGSSAGGGEDGGSGGYNGGAGGAASDIRTSITGGATSVASLNTRIVTGGGGGGASANCNNANGGAAGYTNGSAGGASTNGCSSAACKIGGGGGTQGAGGTVGGTCQGSPTAGFFGAGGNSPGGSGLSYGGGGGGGWYGGGAAAMGGGGGGSSHYSATNLLNTPSMATNNNDGAVTICYLPGITVQPGLGSACVGGSSPSLTFSVNASSGVTSYQWFSSATNVNTGGTSLGSASGAQTITYTGAPTGSAGTYYYYCVVSNACGSQATNCSIVTIASNPPTPATPVISSATQTCNSLSFGWSSVPNATNYKLEIATDNGFSSIVFSGLVGNVTSYTQSTGLSSGTTYYYHLLSNNACATVQNSAYTTTASILTNVTPSITGGVSALCMPSSGSTTYTGTPVGGVWASSNTLVATVSGGVAGGVSTGSATISYTSGGCLATRNITVGPEANVINITPTTAASLCLGAGQQFTATSATPAASVILSNNFNNGVAAGTVGGTWAVTSSGSMTSGNAPWQAIADGGSLDGFITIHSNDNSQVAGAVSDGHGGVGQTILTSPAFSLNGMSTTAGATTLTYYLFYQAYFNDQAYVGVEISVNGGAWTQVGPNLFGTTIGSGTSFVLQTIDLGAYAGSLAGNSNLRLRWNYGGTNAEYIAIDNILLTAQNTMTYSWSAIAPAINANISNTAINNPTITPSLVGTSIYSVTATYGGCAQTAGVSIFATNVAPVAVALSPSSSTCNSITLNWAAAGGATSYIVAISPNSNMSSPVFGPANVGNVLTYTQAGLSGGTTYYYTVTGTNTCGGNGPTTAITSQPTTTTPTNTGGITALCMPAGGSVNTTYIGAPAGGTWSSSNISVATVSGGVVGGVATGSATISYGSGGCYATRALTVGPAPGVINISPNTAASVCLGSGQQFTVASATPDPTVVLSNNFNSGVTTGTFGGAWTVSSSGSLTTGAGPWQSYADGGSLDFNTIHSNDNSAIAGAQSNTFNGGGQTLLISPSFSLNGFSTTAGATTLTYYLYYAYYSSDQAYIGVEISVNGGAWTQVGPNLAGTSVGSATNFVLQTIDLGAYAGSLAGNNNLRLRWNYGGGNGLHIGIDNVLLTTQYPMVYLWSATAPATNANISNTAINNPTITPTLTGTNVYSVSVSYGSCSQTAGVSVFATNTAPTIPILGASSVTCNSATINWGGGTGATNFEVAISANSDMSSPLFGPTLVGNVLTYTQSTGLSGNTTYYYRVRGTNTCGGFGPSTAITSVATSVTPGISGGTSPLCMPLTTTYIGTPSGGAWSSSNTSVATATAGVAYSVAPGTTNIIYTYSGCTASSALTINPGPTTISITPATTGAVCLGSGTAFTASSASPAATVVMSNNFNSGSVTAGTIGGAWTVNNTGSLTSGAAPWQYYADGGSLDFNVTHSNDNSGFAGAQSNTFNGGGTTILTSPSFSLNGYSTTAGATKLTYYLYYAYYSSDQAYVGVEINVNGGGWTQIGINYSGTSVGSATSFLPQTVDLGAYAGSLAGNNNIKVRWNYGGGNGLHIAIDNVVVSAQYPMVYAWSATAPATAANVSNTAIGGPVTITPTNLGVNTYSVTATYNGCVATAGVAVTATAAPAAFSMSQTGSLCTGTGATFGVTASVSGVNYQLKVGGTNVGSPVAGNGGAITFPSQSTAGVYTIVASNATGCATTTTSTNSFTISATPSAFSMTQTGSFCAGTGLVIGLGTTQTGINYQLQKDGVNVGAPVAGTGSAIVGAYTSQTTAGLYTVVATAAAGCPTAVTSTNSYTINAAPAAFSMSQTGSFCTGDGLVISVASSVSGVSYQLKQNGSNLGAPVAGTGGTISFPSQSAAGAYTVVASNATGCPATTTSTNTYTINAAPTAFSMTQTGSFCSTGAGLVIGLGTTQTGVNYQLQRAGTNVGAPVAGTGSAIVGAYAAQTTQGTYSVVASNATGCPTTVISTNNYVINTPPTAVSPTLSLNTVCANDPVSLNGGVTGGTNLSYAWSGPVTAHITSVTALNTGIAATVVGDAGTYTISVTAAGCAPVNGGTAALTVNKLPSLTASTTPNPQCTGNAVALNGGATGGSGASYSWAGPVTSHIASSTSLNTSITSVATADAGVYTLTASAAVCGSTAINTSATPLVVNQAPAAITNNVLLCVGGAHITLGETSTGGTWTSSNTSMATVDPNTGDVTPLAAGNPVITYGNGGAACVATVALTINPAPVAIAGNPTMCDAGNPISLSDASAGGTWSSNNTNVSVNAATGQVTPLTAGTSLITYSNGQGIGCSATITATVNVAPVAIAGNPTMCATGSTTFLSDASVGGTWTSITTSVATVNAATGEVFPITAGTSSIRYSNGAGAGCKVFLTATVNPTPVATTGNTLLCANGDHITLVETANGGTWSSSDLTMATVDVASGSVTPLLAGNPIITYSNGAGAACQVTTALTINTAPVAITGNPTLCVAGTSVALGETSTGGTWSSSDITVAVVDILTGEVSSANNNAGNAIITYSNGAGTGCSTSVTATVNPTPVAISGNPTLCVGGSTYTLSEASAGGTWSSTDPTMAAVGLTSGILTPGANPGNPVITYTNGAGASCSTQITATVNTAPAPITGNPTLCVAGTSVALGETATAGTWSSNDITVAVVDQITGVLSSANNNSGTAIITYANGSGCNASITATVNPTPVAITGNPTLCVGGGTTTLGETSGGGTWSSSNAAIAAVGLTSGVLTPGSTIAGNPVITYSNGQGAGCSTAITATVNTTPQPITGNPTMCVAGTSISLTETATAGTWSSSNTTMATVNVLTGVVTPSGVNPGNPVITYSNGAGIGCSTSITATVNPTPVAITNNVPLCVASPAITLTNASAGGTWTSANGTVTIGQTTGLLSPVSVGNSTITYRNGAGAGCSTTTTSTVNATPTPITGNVQICNASQTISLVESAGGGTWTSATTTVATVNATSGLVTSAGAGNSVVTFRNGGTGCSAQVTVTVNALPTPTFTTAPGVNSCVGGSVTYTTQSGQANYTWTVTGVVNVDYTITSGGTTSTDNTVTLTWNTTGSKTVNVNYTNSNGCVGAAPVSNTTLVNPLPTVVTVDPNPGPYCGSTTLTAHNGGSGTIYFQGITSNGTSTLTPYSGSQVVNVPGLNTYYFRALSAAGCFGPQGSTAVTINANPTAYAMAGGGSYCTGGIAVRLANSASAATPVVYQLYVDGNPTGAPVNGTGGVLNFGNQLTVGAYTAIATNTVTLCTAPMTGSVNVTQTSQPLAHTMTGGGSYCTGGTGVSVGLDGSEVGITYQLYNNGSAVGGLVAGTGGAIDFGTALGITGFTSGVYTAVGNPGSACALTMTGNATVTVSPAPTAFALGGGGTTCAGGSGLDVTLSGSQTNIDYHLFNNGVPVTILPGTNFMLVFSGQNTSGVYTIIANNPSTGCSASMTGSVTVTVNPKPIAYTVSGTGSYCAGGTGVDVQLSNTENGVTYQLLRNGVNTGISYVSAGTGSHDFGMQTLAGTYTISAQNNTTNCTNTMSGSAVISIDPLPSIYTVTGGGSYCPSGAGVPVGLSFSSTVANYRLYNNFGLVAGPVTGTGAAITFGNQLVAGTYSITATNVPSGCSITMNGTATVSISTPPTNTFTISAGGSYCAGGTGVDMTLSGSQTATSYQLYIGGVASGSPVIGTGGSLDLGNQTAQSNNYTVVGTSQSTGCSSTMTGVGSVTINALPTIFAVSGGGTICSGGTGVAVGMSNSTAGISYQLYRNGIATADPAVVSAGGAFSFAALQTIAGSYTVVGRNTTTSCTNTMGGSVTVTVNPLPTAFTVSGGGTICSGGTGVAIGLSGSQSGANYQLLLSGSPAGSVVAGTGFAITFGNQSAAGPYTVSAINTTTTCSSNMTGTVTVTVNPLPTAYAVTGGGGYCPGGTGVHIGLFNSQSGVSYQLYVDGTPTGTALNGTTGNALDFGLQTATGVYTIGATNTTTSCTAMMTGSKTITINTPPTAYAVTGGGGYCPTASGVVVGLGGSQSGVNYQLQVNGVNTGLPVAGTGSALTFGTQPAGNYTVIASNTTTGCTATMSGTATVVLNSVPTAFAVSGTGSYCSGGTGVDVTLGGSQIGVNYQLFRNGTPLNSPVSGSGLPYDFGNQTLAGTYTASAINTTTGCVNNMTGSAVITINALPVAYIVTGGGAYCNGGTGTDVSISNTENGVTYQLVRNGVNTGSPYASAGTGAHSFGNQAIAGVYTITAMTNSTTCMNTMSGSVTVSINPLPTVYAVSGGGAYCPGGTGVHVGLGSTSTGVSYQLYNNGTATGTAIAGTGSGIDFGLQTAAGTYSVLATNSTTGCTQQMSGTGTVVISTPPTVFTVSAAGTGTYCAGGTGVSVLLSGSQTGVNYQLYRGSTAIGSPVSGTGGNMDLGLQTAGTYSVSATSASTTCTSNMAGGATITTTPLPTAYTMSGTGGYCAGGTGISPVLSNSDAGITYQLYRGSTAIPGASLAGNGTPLTFAAQTTAGTYTILATNNTTGCTNVMTGSAVITINPLPTVYAVGGGGTMCAGSTGLNVTVSNSQTGVNYQLYINGVATGSPVAGSTGAAISFGAQSTNGTYSVVATDNTTGCISPMSGTATVTVNPLPTVFAMTGGGGYCTGGAGMSVGLAGSQIGVSYQLYLNSVATGTPAAGTGSSLDFGVRTLAGTYTIIATNTATNCTGNMSGNATIAINPLPNAYAMTGGGGYCAGGSGLNIGLANSQTGVSYQLYRGAGAIGAAVAGTGAAIDLGVQATAGTYTVLATTASTGCTRVMSGTSVITINALPQVYGITGGGSYCTGGVGVHVGLSNSEFGLSYQLYNNGVASGAPVTGTGSAIDLGFRTVAGTYTVIGTNTATSCTNNMSGTATITITALPTAFAVTGGGSYCAGGTGSAIGVANTQTNTTYQLSNGSGNVGGPVAGTGSSISFGLQLAAGTYSVVATNTGGCSSNMSGTATITINALPTVYTVTGGGSYCAGGAGQHIGLTGSTVGIGYQLYNAGGAAGSAVPGTGTTLDLGTITAAGTYSVVAMNAPTGCNVNMSGTATIIVNTLPTAYNVTNGGQYCAGGAGVDVSLANSQNGVNYQLYNNGLATGVPVAGTNAAISFGLQVAAGTYSVGAVNATTGCTAPMTGTVSVTINPLPTVYTVTGGGSYCTGSTGVHAGLGGSNTGITYKLYNGATLAATISGTGSAIDFGVFTTAGTYTVVATDNITNCTRVMSGSAVVSVNALPAPHSVTGGGAYCAGGTGVAIGLNGSDNGISYQLYNGSTVTGLPVAGNNGTITFGLQLAAGTYSVSAVNSTTGCAAGMGGSATITVNALPTVYAITGGGSYCAGTAGVAIGTTGSQSGLTYVLQQNGTAVATLPGSASGAALSFGLQPAGTYTIYATSGSCQSNMSGTAIVTQNPLPQLHTVTGGGGYCAGGAGLAIGLDGSNSGTSYQLYNTGVPSGAAVTGNGSAISFGVRVAAGNYTVIATNTTTGCTQQMTGSATMTINTLPIVYNITGGGAYCAGGTGVVVGIDNSEAGTTYQLYNGATQVASINSTGGAFDFGVRPAGSYTIRATNGSSCTGNMSGTATVTMNPLPTVYSVTGGGAYCAGGTGMTVGLSGSQAGVTYQLYNAGGAAGSPVGGTGNTISFGAQTAAGTYSVVAVNNTTTCTNLMSGTATVSINALPVAQSVTGGGSYCAGGAGVDIALGGSQGGVSYALYNGSTLVNTVAGTGNGIDLGMQTAAGTYVVIATNTTTHCTNNMSGSAVVSINTLPVVYILGSSASNYCAGGTGVDITLSGSEAGLGYQLYNNNAPVGAPVAGTGNAIDLGMQLAPGTYTAMAMNSGTGCTSTMSASINIVVNQLPTAYAMTGGGSYCAGTAGVHVGLGGSQTGIRYDLYNGSNLVTSLNGTGGTLDFGVQTAGGTYIVNATNTLTTCTSSMSGTAIVTVNTLPTAYVMSGGGDHCAGGAGMHVGLTGSQSGTTYQLYLNGLPTGTPVGGTGNTIDFGIRTAAGVYTIVATNSTTGCTNNMSGTATINILAAPATYAVTGGGSYCTGGTGVAVGLGGSQSGVSYQLYYNNNVAGSPVSGSGNAITFGQQAAPGVYTVIATNGTGGCTATMSGTASVAVNTLPSAFTVTGGGSYCSGTGGRHVGLSGSATGIKYQLYLNGSTVGVPVNGTGNSLDLGAQTAPGTYMVYATNNTTTCTSNMTGSATIVMNPTVVPAVTMISTPGDTVCAGTNVQFALLTSNGGTNPAYDWTVNGNLSVSSASNYNYVPQNGDVVTVTLTSSEVCATPATVSFSKTMTVNTNVTPMVSVTASLGDTVCRGTIVTFNAASVYGGTTPGYTWMVNGTPASTGSSYSYAPANNDVIMVQLTSNYPCRSSNTAFSAPIKMTADTAITPSVAIQVAPGNRVAQGQTVTMTAVVPDWIPGVTYQWLINGNPVPGASHAVFVNSNYSDLDSVTCMVTATSACGSLSAFNSVIMYIQGVGVGTVGTNASVQLMPNPNKGEFTVKGTMGSNTDEEVTIEVTDVLGQVVYRSKAMSHGGVISEQVHMANTVANGMYVLSLKTTTDTKVFHVVIEQ